MIWRVKNSFEIKANHTLIWVISEGAGSRKTSLVDLLYGYPAEQFWATPYRRMSLPDHWQAQFFYRFLYLNYQIQTKKPGLEKPSFFAALVGLVGFEPTANRLCIPLQLLLPLSSLWAGLSLHPRPKRWGACHLVSTPSL